MTFAEYRQAAEVAAAGLAAMGIGEDTAVTWQLPTVRLQPTWAAIPA